MYELDDFSKDLLKLATIQYPKKVKSLLLKQGTKLKNKVAKNAKSGVNKATGSYHKGFKRGKHYKFKGDDAVRVYTGDPKAHLIEYGHEVVDRNGQSHGFVSGRHVLENTSKQFEDEFNKACGEFLDDLLEKGW